MKIYFIIFIIFLQAKNGSTFNLNLKGIADNVSLGFIVRKQLRTLIFDNDHILNNSIGHITQTDCEIAFVYSLLLTSTIILSYRDEKLKKIFVIRKYENLKILEFIILTLTIVMSKSIESAS
jgi:hypothetical protein